VATYKVVLSDGSVIWLDDVRREGEREVAQRSLEGRLSEVLPSIVSLCQDLTTAVKDVAPTKASIEFGISFQVESAGLALLVVKGGSEANFKISLEWEQRTA
jgi:hypothetical protein